MPTFFMGHEIRPRIGDYNIFCEVCLDRFHNDGALNTLDWSAIVKSCSFCVGTNRCPIPLAEVINIRGHKIGNEQ